MSSFPHFSVDDIIFRNVSHQSGFIFFMIIHFKYTRRTFYYSIDSITYWFYLLHKFKMSSLFSGNFQFTKKTVLEFQISGTFSTMEMEKISGSFPYVKCNQEFLLKLIDIFLKTTQVQMPFMSVSSLR